MSAGNDWPTVKLGDLGRFASGGTPNRRKPEFYKGETAWISSADISEGGNISPRRFITDEAIATSATTAVPAGTLLITVRIGVGKTAITTEKTCFSQDVVAMLDLDESRVSVRFLQFMIAAVRPHLEQLSRGVTIKGITIADLKDLTLPLPPLAEQRRIATLLDAAQGVIDALDRQIKQLFRARSSLWKEFAGEQRVPLSDLATIRNESVVPTEAPYLTRPHVAPNNVQPGTGRLLDVKTVEEDGMTSRKNIFYPGDLLYSKIRPYLNKVTIAGFEGVSSSDMYAFTMKEDLPVELLAIILQSPEFLVYADQQTSGANIPRINKKSLLSFMAPSPDKPTLDRVISTYRIVQKTWDQLEQRHTLLKELQASLSARAFAGKL